MIIGAAGESDYEIMTVSEALYQRFDLKRVFYSAFINVNQDADLPALESGPPLRREHRLYQADFLLRYYGFEADELLSPSDRISMYFWIRNVTGRWGIWSRFRWRSTLRITIRCFVCRALV